MASAARKLRTADMARRGHTQLPVAVEQLQGVMHPRAQKQRGRGRQAADAAGQLVDVVELLLAGAVVAVAAVAFLSRSMPVSTRGVGRSGLHAADSGTVAVGAGTSPPIWRASSSFTARQQAA
jgi:hypothetical protein